MSGNSSVNVEPCPDWVSSGTRCTLRGGRAALPVDPYHALCVHFGMLLGVDDFETLDAYHRGKAWLHNAWLHREGVVWGFKVTLEPKHGRIRVSPGLAVDTFGRELHLGEDRCLDLARWYEKHKNDLDQWYQKRKDELIKLKKDDELAKLEKEEADGKRRFPAHVVVGFDSCLERQVPALLEPCEGAGGITAYSRVFETVELLLRLGPAPKPGEQDGQRALPYHRLRLLFGLDEPIGGSQDDDRQVLDAKSEILGLPTAKQAAAWLEAFRRFAALDVIDLRPRSGADDASVPLVPEPSRTYLELAEIPLEMQRVQGQNGPWSFVYGEADKIDSSVRPSHVATSTIQELLCGVPALFGYGMDRGGPKVVDVKVELPAAGNDPTRIVLTADHPLEPNSVTMDAFQVSAFTGAKWEEVPMKEAGLDDQDKTIIRLQTLSSPANVIRLRIIAHGTGPRPILGATYLPLAGGRHDPPGTEHDGRDFVLMMTYKKE